MGQKLGEQELARADVVIRPRVGNIGPAEFEQRNQAIIEGEKAALAALPQIRARIAQLQKAKMTATIKNNNMLSTHINHVCEASSFTDKLFGNVTNCKTKN
jgi:NTE family protein